jgi:chemotaxis family two-component system response regulator Rcp1
MRTTSRPIEILVAEDNPGDIRLIREALRAHSTDVRLNVVADGEAALAFLRREEPYTTAPHVDLALLDFNLPRLNGRAVLCALRAEPALRRLPVVVLTGSSEPLEIAAAYDLGANAVVTKPLDLDEFFVAISSIATFWGDVAARPRA